MRGLSFLNKIVFTINILFALLLFLACLSPYISTKILSFLPFLGLAVPALVIINLLFFVYWSLKRKKQLGLSLLALLIGFISLGTFVRFGGNDKKTSEDDLTVLSYNVRDFNKYGNIESETVFEDIKIFVDDQKPDIICFQEVSKLRWVKNYDYPYKYLNHNPNEEKTLLGILSKHPIIKADLIHFPNTKNNACYADIVVREDTIRVYNLHMQSLGITPGQGVIRSSSSEKLYKKLASSFKKQEEQAQIIAEHGRRVAHKKLICGDFNNGQFSKTYNLIKGDKKDSFDEKGTGYGRTFIFHGMPARIDFILADPKFEITSHQNFDQKYSDHFPIMASFRLGGD